MGSYCGAHANLKPLMTRNSPASAVEADETAGVNNCAWFRYSFVIFKFFKFFETGSCYPVQVDLELMRSSCLSFLVLGLQVCTITSA